MTESTRERILRVALELFAEQGYKATSVAEIEAASGLSPGSGGLYKHIRSKADLLRAAVEAQLERIQEVKARLHTLPVPLLTDAAPELEAIGHASLAAMANQRDLTMLLLREAATLADAVPGVLQAWIHDTYTDAADQMRRQVQDHGLDPGEVDYEAHAVVSLAPLVLFRIIEWLTGAAPGGVDEDRLVAAWTFHQVALRDHLRSTLQPAPAEPAPAPTSRRRNP